jgi:hypothetical protein
MQKTALEAMFILLSARFGLQGHTIHLLKLSVFTANIPVHSDLLYRMGIVVSSVTQVLVLMESRMWLPVVSFMSAARYCGLPNKVYVLHNHHRDTPRAQFLSIV